MSLRIDKLKIKNFLSVGNTEQEIDMNNNLMTLLVGINKDKDSEGSSNGSGKAQPLDAKIRVPHGWKSMGDIAIGDIVIGKNGSETKVDGIFPQGKKSVYKIEFADGRSTEATKDHLWQISKLDGVNNSDVVTTSKLMELLGNNSKIEMETGTSAESYIDCVVPYDISKLCILISKEIISDIPEDFMDMSVVQFVDLYCGLGEYNGINSVNGNYIISIQKSILDKFINIATRHGYYIEVLTTIENMSIICIHTDGLIPLKSIKYVGVKECQCIHVTSSDHLYVTDDYILTHNTTCINALSYAIYGESLSEIKKDNLVNKTNSKNMEVTLDFIKDSIKYKIHRGRKPNILKFYIDDNEYDETRASVRDTQSEIEYIFGMSYLMFKTIVVLDSTNVPFLSLKDKDRKPIIEELLGITILSKKAENLKQQIKEIKQQIKNEELKLNLKISNNDRIQQNIKNLHIRKDLWDKDHYNKIEMLQTKLDEVNQIDIVSELENHLIKEEYNKIEDTINSLVLAQQSICDDINIKTKDIEKTFMLLEEAKNHKCPECKQDIHSEVYENIIKNLNDKIKDLEFHIKNNNENKLLIEDEMLLTYDKLSKMDNPTLIYSDIRNAYQHVNSQQMSEKNLQVEIEKENPFVEQIKNLEESSLEDISYNDINSLTVTEDHMTFLYKLLTNSDSFIRKNIIDQNLCFLNNRLAFYSEQMMLLQDIKFNNDLSISIMKGGDEFDFSQLSTGEKTRVTISLSLSFRDVWERLNTSINIWFFDEIIDSGMDLQGIQDAIILLEQFVNERNKDVFLISHKLDLAANIENVLYAVMENGFTEYQK